MVVCPECTCKACRGAGYILDSAGQVVACSKCNAVDYAAQSGLTEDELRLNANSIGILGSQMDKGAQQILRWLVGDVIANPAGWITLWGSYGTAKTLAIQAMVAGLVRKGLAARFYHAKRLEQGWFDDMHGDTANATLYSRVRVLAIDEAHTVNLKSDWTRAKWQELMDNRYRSGLAGTTLTLLICQQEPHQCMPGDVASRMADGRFYRPWPGAGNCQTVQRADWGAGHFLPGIIHVQGQDMRPHMPPRRRA